VHSMVCQRDKAPTNMAGHEWVEGVDSDCGALLLLALQTAPCRTAPAPCSCPSALRSNTSICFEQDNMQNIEQNKHKAKEFTGSSGNWPPDGAIPYGTNAMFMPMGPALRLAKNALF
jgi:hypothetical protein